MRRWLPLSILLLALGAGTPESSIGSQPTRVVTWGDWGAFVGRDLPGKGIASQIVKEAFRDIHESIPIDFHPWPRAYREALEGNYLAAFPYAKSEERLKDFHFSEPLFTTTIRLFISQNHPLQPRAAQKLERPRVCIPKGYNKAVARDWFDPSSLILERPRAMKNCMRMLARGRVDFVLASQNVGWYVIQNEPELHVSDFRHLPRSRESSVHIMVSRELENGEKLIDRINTRLTEMRANGRIKALFKDYNRFPGH